MQHHAGELLGILARPGEGLPVQLATSARIDPTHGLEGDYQKDMGRPAADERRWITLISVEGIAAAAADGVSLEHPDTRRNLLTKGIDLNALVDKEFTVGDVTLKGTSLCHPCSTLEKRTKAGALAAFKMRGGLCATIVKGGTVRIGDSILT